MPPLAAKRSRADLTDADVLGFRFSADGPVDCFLADCKSAQGRATDRVFWVKGLADYLNAKNTYLFKYDVQENARWLASRLGIIPLDEWEQNDLINRLGLPFKGPYFDQAGRDALVTLQNAFAKGTRYREVASFLVYTIWSLSPSVRVLSLLDLLNPESVNQTFNPKDHKHQGLVLLGALQLGISLGLTISNLCVADLPVLDRRLRETLHEGPATFEQKLKYMHAFSQYQGIEIPHDESALDLPSFPNLLELVNRLILRRNYLNDAIRIIDIATYYHASNQSYPHSPRWLLEPITQKMATDILELFVRANGLKTGFLDLLDFPTSAPTQPQKTTPSAESDGPLDQSSLDLTNAASTTSTIEPTPTAESTGTVPPSSSTP
jgi:hypothetical protein